ncbi:MAG TPA: MliC family protein [Acidobacteriota bacterium]|nr:MliC family protein [Acidobacteriota bacterium]
MNLEMRLGSKVGAAVLAVVAISNCSQANREAEQQWLAFRCPDGRTVMAQFESKDEFVKVRFAGGELRLPHVISGSGARYSDGKTVFWNKGKSVLVEIDDKIIVQDCVLDQREKLLGKSFDGAKLYGNLPSTAATGAWVSE